MVVWGVHLVLHTVYGQHNFSVNISAGWLAVPHAASIVSPQRGAPHIKQEVKTDTLFSYSCTWGPSVYSSLHMLKPVFFFLLFVTFMGTDWKKN